MEASLDQYVHNHHVGRKSGLGFAIPAGELAFAYPQLVKFGHIHQPELGALIQTITPELAAVSTCKKISA